MAVPTITAVSPSTGPAAGGNLVEISGTNFRTVAATPAIPVVTPSPSVQVTVNGVAATYVFVASSTCMRFICPAYTGDAFQASFPAVAVAVQNLDDDGAAISGELATRSAGYTYTRWGLRAPRKETPLLRVGQKLLERLLREVTPNVAMSTHTDFDAEASATMTVLAANPGLNVTMDFPRDGEYAQWDNGFEEVTRPDGDIDLYRGQRTYMIACKIYAAGEGESEANHLAQAVFDSVQAAPYLYVPADSDLFPGETDQYPIEITMDPTKAGSMGGTNTQVYQVGLRVRGVRTMMDYPVARIRQILSASLIHGPMADGTLQTWDVF